MVRLIDEILADAECRIALWALGVYLVIEGVILFG